MNNIFSKTINEEELFNDSEENYIDITGKISKPTCFDDVKYLCQHYINMEKILNILDYPNVAILIDEDPENKDADQIALPENYMILFKNLLEDKMTEIRNVLNYN